MPENAGGIYVSIDADSSPLLVKYRQAEAESRAAGQRIASALGSGFQQGTGLVDQFGRAVESTVVPTEEATVAVRALGRAHAEAVSEVQAMSGALRVLEGNGGLRAAERFLATTVGLGGIAQAAFPIIGLIAVGEILEKVSGKFAAATKQSEEFKQSLRETDQASKGLIKTLDSIQVDKMRDAFGGAAGERMRAAVLESEAFDKLAEKAKVVTQLAQSQNADWLQRTFGKVEDADALRQKITQLSLESQALAAQADEARRHANEVTGPREASDAAKKAEEERNRAAREAAEFERRTQRAAVEGVAISRREAAKEEKELLRTAKEEELRGLEETSRQFEIDERERMQAIQAEVRERNRVNQESIRETGIRQQGTDEVAILRAKYEYATQIVHTREEEILRQHRLAELEEQKLQDQIDSLRTLRDYQAQNLLTTEQQKTELDIAKEQNALDKLRLENQTRMTELTASPLGRQIAGIGAQIPSRIGDSLASGAVEGNIGREVANALKQTGRDILGTALTAAIKELVIKTGLQTVATNLMHAVFGASTATQATATGALTTATAAQTAAVIANTAALTASGGASVASGVASTAATAASTAATGAVAGIIGPVIGGVISGVISAAATFIGDAAIVKAVNQTTAAVLSLRTVTISQGGPSSKPVTVQPSTSFFDSFKAGIFQSLTGAGALPVKLVAINPFLGVASALSIFGFASGGRPPVGMPSIVGERGPELFVPDVPGFILPSVPNSGAYSAASVLMTASAVTNSSSNAMSIGAIHLHGIASAEQFARQLPNVLKSRAPAFSPATR